MRDVLYPLRMLCLLATLLTACGAIGFAAWSFSVKQSGASTVGEVIDLRLDKEGFYHPVYTFTDRDGKVHIVESSLGTAPAAYEKGQQVPVVYPLSTPENATLATGLELWAAPIFLAVLAVLSLSASIALSFLERHLSKPAPLRGNLQLS